MTLTRSRRLARSSGRASCSSGRFGRPRRVTPCWRRFASSPSSGWRQRERRRRRGRHAELFRDLVDRAEPMLLGTADQRRWWAWLEDTYDNVRAALAWSVSADGDLAVGIALAGAL